MRRTAITMVLMTAMMGGFLSAVFTWQAQGVAPGFAAAWAARFFGTWVLVLPSVAVFAPLAGWLAGRIDGWITRQALRLRR